MGLKERRQGAIILISTNNLVEKLAFKHLKRIFEFDYDFQSKTDPIWIKPHRFQTSKHWDN